MFYKPFFVAKPLKNMYYTSTMKRLYLILVILGIVLMSIGIAYWGSCVYEPTPHFEPGLEWGWVPQVK